MCFLPADAAGLGHLEIVRHFPIRNLQTIFVHFSPFSPAEGVVDYRPECILQDLVGFQFPQRFSQRAWQFGNITLEALFRRQVVNIEVVERLWRSGIINAISAAPSMA
jgi:hypothetical protein